MTVVYARGDSAGNVVSINSGVFLKDTEDWIKIDEGEGDRYTLAHGNYLQGGLQTEQGVYRCLLVDGKVIPKTQEQIDEETEVLLEEARYAEPSLQTKMVAALPLLRVQAIASCDDSQLFEAKALFDAWMPGMVYAADTVLRHKEGLYRVQQAHMAHAHQSPSDTGMLSVYSPIQLPKNDIVVSPWIRGEAIQIGGKRSYEDIIYECYANVGVNVWTPNTFAAGWRLA